jgi:hypothetical protein
MRVSNGAKWMAAALVFCGSMGAITPAQAHLVAAQKGTLNFVGNAAFLVLSVPVSSLRSVDDDGDGMLSKADLSAHADEIKQQVKDGVQLMGPAGALPLQLVVLDIESPESAPDAPASHLVVLGRYELEARGKFSVEPNAAASDGLSLRFTLFGNKPGEQVEDLTVTRQKETQWLRFTADNNFKPLLPSAMVVFSEYVRSGATHVLSGPDHMLFLLLVLSAGLSLSALLGALTCFTAGHAITLSVSVLGGMAVSDRITEPAIAATIVGMAAFDIWTRRRAKVLPSYARFSMIFGCALVHGLGLAEALRDVTQWPSNSTSFALALAGFNLGIESAQIAVALMVGLMVLVLSRINGLAVRQRVVRHSLLVGLLAGSFWFIERIAHGA